MSRTSSDNPTTWTKNPSAAGSTPVTSQSSSLTTTTEPGAALKVESVLADTVVLMVLRRPLDGGREDERVQADRTWRGGGGGRVWRGNTSEMP